mmetsp:Transcript_27776/g.89760  ORF Transcript_27776/g.89760 Transcript_27776/m.89760 type:complete len:454 (-) Transcript_27776:191-1552(-)
MLLIKNKSSAATGGQRSGAMPLGEETVSGADLVESEKCGTESEVSKKRNNRKKKNGGGGAPSGGAPSVRDAEDAVEALPAHGETDAADGNVGKSASQIKREKQKAAAARRRAAVTATLCLDTHFATRYVDGAVGLEAERARLSSAAEANAARVTQLREAGKEPQEVAQIMHALAQAAAPRMTFDDACATLLRLPSLDAEGVRATDAAREVLDLARLETEQFQPGSNPKLLPRTLKWCAANLPALNALLAATPEAKADAPTGRLGLARLFLAELFITLATAKRPPLTSALVACRPAPAAALASLLLSTHSTSTILGDAVLRLIRATLQAGTKPLRAAALSGPEPLQSIVVAALFADVAAVQKKEKSRLAPLRPFWIEMATAVEAAAAADKEVKATLTAQEGWAELVAALPALRARHAEGYLCGPPPARPLEGMGGEMGELLAMLQRVQGNLPPC